MASAVRELQFLVVDDDPRVARSVVRRLRQHGTPHVAGNVAESLTLLDTDTPWSGACVDLVLPDGSGLDVVKRFRAEWPVLPVMVLTAWMDGDVINQVHAMGADYVAKPPSEKNFKRFIEQATKATERQTPTISDIVRDAAERWRLSPRERITLGLAAQGLSRREIAEQMSVTPETIKTHTSAILAKTGFMSLREVVKHLLAAPVL